MFCSTVRRRWLGFVAGAPVCTVCAKSPATYQCHDCDDQFCRPCFKVFHSKGRKRQHKPAAILEQLKEGQSYCALCQRRAGTEACATCSRTFCDSCFACAHVSECENQHRQLSIFDATKHAKDCVVCGRPAASICTTCGDYFCTLGAADGPTCFARIHAKGKRAAHYQLLFSDIEPDEDPLAAAARVRERMERDAQKDIQRAVTQQV